LQGGFVNDVVLQLLELQKADGQCGDLASRINGLEVQKQQLRDRFAQERSAVEKNTAHLEELEQNSRMMNLEVDKLDAQIRDYQHRLDTGIISFKEMESLRTKIINQRSRMEAMEDEALLLMNQIEERVVEQARQKEQLTARETEIENEIAKLDEQIAGVESELASWKQKRQELVLEIPMHSVHQYEHLHGRFEDPVVPIINGVCGGCKLSVSGTTIERARDGMEIVTCENCSRIVYAR
jgi:uncharacterized protein